MTPQPKSTANPVFGGITVPKKKGRTGTRISEDVAEGLMVALEDAHDTGADDGFVSDGLTYDTNGKAQAQARRLRRALLDHKKIDDVKSVQTRVFRDGDADDAPFRFALRLRTPEDKKADTAKKSGGK